MCPHRIFLLIRGCHIVTYLWQQDEHNEVTFTTDIELPNENGVIISPEFDNPIESTFWAVCRAELERLIPADELPNQEAET